ncbi:MAG: ATP-dependent DNA helicase [Lachnospiraceae bacterium]|nr:ATP-dependent DNA helicase [Lachnospiraceae bacterium]
MEIRISVRNLVEFILRSGDIDNRKGTAPDSAMAEGSRIHRMIQKRMDSSYQAEVPLSFRYTTGRYDIVVDGRADGIIHDENGITVDEIKGTYRDLEKMKAPVPVHLAQAKCYAFFYWYKQEEKPEQMRVRMTYCHLDTEELKYFYEEYGGEELEDWFLAVIRQYQKWSDFEYEWREKRKQSIQNLAFPFPYREGQKELASYVYQTIYHKKKLFIEAPTGVGKTITTVFPAIQAVGRGMGDKIFYLTAKTITRTVAADTFALLREKGLLLKSVLLTAKEKICFLEEPECNPEKCPYAKGHFDRINDAVYDLLTHSDNFDRAGIEGCAEKHQVCPFELGLDMSLFSDAVICDYNYVFDPHVYLRRFFAEGVKGDYLFLIDEAHNLVERGREMYSASLKKEDFLSMKKKVREADRKLERQLEKCNKELLALKRECETYRVVEFISPFVIALNRVHATMEAFLENHEDGELRQAVLEFYFQISHFLDIYERVDDNYVTYTQMLPEGEFMLKLFCVNPRINLQECMGRGRSTILFSATFLPIQYYKNLLGGEAEDYEVYAKSVFDNKKRMLLIGCDVTSKYSRRSNEEYYNIAAYLHEIIKNRHGNYMVFFPSHLFLKEVLSRYEEKFQGAEVECIVQGERMTEKEREEFLQRFAKGAGQEDTMEQTLVGFCVLGGIFSEGIDLKNDSLIGAIVVGTGIPQVCEEREILKEYFDANGRNGFDYAYRYPGMNKVLQAAGRVIRTAEDVGIIALLDDRFLQRSYQQLFPREWEQYEVVEREQAAHRVERFWDEWL